MTAWNCRFIHSSMLIFFVLELTLMAGCILYDSIKQKVKIIVLTSVVRNVIFLSTSRIIRASGAACCLPGDGKNGRAWQGFHFRKRNGAFPDSSLEHSEETRSHRQENGRPMGKQQ